MSSTRKIDWPVAVSARTFSKHPVLREELKRVCTNVKFNETGRTLQGAELVEFLKGARAAIVALEKMSADVVAKLPELKVIGKYGVGLDNIDQEALARHGIQMGWKGGVNRRSVSELALMLALSHFRNLWISHKNVVSGRWEAAPGCELSGKTFGIIGFGNIGKDLAGLLKPFGCQILVHDVRDIALECQSYGATPANFEEVLRTADVVSLHVPYDTSTHQMISDAELSLLKPNAILINTSRGKIVDESALLKALQSRVLQAAAMDVFEVEPAIASPLVKLDNFFATPHIGGSSAEGVLAMGRSAIQGLVDLCNR